MYANTGIATDSARVARSAKRARLLARGVRRFFIAAPMPHLQEPAAPAAPAPVSTAYGVRDAAQDVWNSA
jgi:hypothetical protein